MAVPGIGIGDIAEAIKLTYDGIRALREDDGGARHHYQKARTAIAYRARVIEELIGDASTSKTSSSQTAPDAYQPLLQADNDVQTKLGKFEPSLGRGAKKGMQYGIARKLKYHFEDDKAVREHYERTQPGVDAALLQTMRINIQVVRDLHANQSKQFDDFKVHIDHQLDKLDIRQAQKAIRADLGDLKRIITMLTPLTSSNAALMDEKGDVITARRITNIDTRSLSSSLSEIKLRLMPVSPALNSRYPPSTRNLVWFHQNQASLEQATDFLSDWLTVLCALAAVAIIQQPHMRRVIITQAQKASEDPVLGVLFGCLTAALIRALARVPKQIMLLSDDSITLKTAFGVKVNVSSLYWKTPEIFNGYIQAYFQGPRGDRFYMVKQNRAIAFYDPSGNPPHNAARTETVQRAMVLSAPLLLDHIGLCPKCKSMLNWIWVDLRRQVDYCVACRNMNLLDDDYTEAPFPGPSLSVQGLRHPLPMFLASAPERLSIHAIMTRPRWDVKPSHDAKPTYWECRNKHWVDEPDQNRCNVCGVRRESSGSRLVYAINEEDRSYYRKTPNLMIET